LELELHPNHPTHHPYWQRFPKNSYLKSAALGYYSNHPQPVPTSSQASANRPHSFQELHHPMQILHPSRPRSHSYPSHMGLVSASQRSTLEYARHPHTDLVSGMMHSMLVCDYLRKHWVYVTQHSRLVFVIRWHMGSEFGLRKACGHRLGEHPTLIHPTRKGWRFLLLGQHWVVSGPGGKVYHRVWKKSLAKENQ
jgi:hypothetical protein